MSILDLIGTTITTQSVDAALQQAGLNWEVTNEHLKHPITNEPGEGNAWATMRSDNLRILKWGCGKGYHIVQNRFCFSLVDNMVQTLGCRIARAGEFRGGRRVFMHVETPNQLIIETGSTLILKLLFQNAHDTSMSQRCNIVIEERETGAILPPIRWSMARAFSWRHTASIEGRMEEAAAILTRVVANFSLCGEVYTRLAHQALSSSDANELLRRVYPVPEEPGEEDSNSIHRHQIGELFSQSKAQTSYTMLSTIAQYVDSIQDRKRTSTDNRARSVSMGPGLKLKFLALSELESMPRRQAAEHGVYG